LHQFAAEQPDLNFRNDAVKQELKDILAFWLEKGVDGFRVDAINHSFEVEDFENEPYINPEGDKTLYTNMDHIYTRDLVGSGCQALVLLSVTFQLCFFLSFSKRATTWCTTGVKCWTTTRSGRTTLPVC
jgi:Alpha amylase, catalytic domain